MTLREIAERLAADWESQLMIPVSPMALSDLSLRIEAALREVQAEATAAERAKHANPRDPDWKCRCGTWNNPVRPVCRECGCSIAAKAIEQETP